MPLAPSRNGPDKRVIWVAAPPPIAGAVEDDWQIPLTVRVAATLLAIPGLFVPPVTLPLTVTTAPAAPIISATETVPTEPPVKFPVISMVEPPVTFIQTALVPTVLPTMLPVCLKVPVPDEVTVDPLEVLPVYAREPAVNSVPLDEKDIAGVFVAAARLIDAATLADDPAPRLGVVMQLVVVTP